MATQKEIDQYSVRIYNQARKGSPYNPGLPVDLANLVVSQARHETGNFSSNAFKKHNNAFGYAYYSGSNYQTGPGLIADNGQPVANYRSLEDSVMELVDWIYRRAREGKFPADLALITTPQQYGALLKSAGYFGDTLANYVKGLQAYFKAIPVAQVGGLGLILVAFIAWIYRKQLQ